MDGCVAVCHAGISVISAFQKCVCALYLPELWALGQTRPICTFGYSSKVISKHTHMAGLCAHKHMG